MLVELLYKKGTVQQLPNGSYLLINQFQKQFPAYPDAVMMWNICNGNTFDFLVSCLSIQLGQPTNTLQPEIKKNLDQLVTNGLIDCQQKELTEQDMMMLQQQQTTMLNMLAGQQMKLQNDYWKTMTNIQNMGHQTRMNMINSTGSTKRRYNPVTGEYEYYY